MSGSESGLLFQLCGTSLNVKGLFWLVGVEEPCTLHDLSHVDAGRVALPLESGHGEARSLHARRLRFTWWVWAGVDRWYTHYS